MKCLVFDRGDGVIGFGLMIQFAGIDQFSIVWPDRPPERMTKEFLDSNRIEILGESELSPPMDPPSAEAADPVDPADPLYPSVQQYPLYPSVGEVAKPSDGTEPASTSDSVPSDSAPSAMELV